MTPSPDAPLDPAKIHARRAELDTAVTTLHDRAQWLRDAADDAEREASRATRERAAFDAAVAAHNAAHPPVSTAAHVLADLDAIEDKIRQWRDVPASGPWGDCLRLVQALRAVPVVTAQTLEDGLQAALEQERTSEQNGRTLVREVLAAALVAMGLANDPTSRATVAAALHLPDSRTRPAHS